MNVLRVLFADQEWVNFVGLIAVPIVIAAATIAMSMYARIKQRWVAHGRQQANDENFREQTKQQTRTLMRWMKKQIRLVRDDFATHDAKDDKAFGQVCQRLDTLDKSVKNGNGH